MAGSGVVAATTLTLLYAKYDKNFRDQLSAYLPFINSILSENQQKLAEASKFDDSFLKKKTVPSKSLETKISESAFTLPQVEVSKPVSEAKPAEPVKAAPEKDDLDEKSIKKEIAATFEKAINEENVKITTGQQDGENELRIQLKRQLYVFQEYFKEQFILYKTELKRKLETDLKNKVLQEKAKIADDYEESFKKLKQMEALLQVRDQLDKQEKATKSLWLLSQALTLLMEHNRSRLDKESNPIQIEQQVECIRKVIKDNFPEESLIQIALESLPENAVKNGVYSEEDLIRRYNKVEKVCNHVALVNSDYTTLFGYLKSFAYAYIRPFKDLEFSMSSNPIQVKQISQKELDGTLEVDPKSWDTYDILNRVKLSIENRNLEMALRYANQLTGEPRKVAKDWIRDTREHLEVKQAVTLIQSKIAAINLHQLTFTN